MADFKFDLVSPERRLASLDATEVQIPGADGDMTAMADHAPTITTLRPGILSVTHAKGSDEFFVSGGFAEITGSAVSVLAEKAMPKGEVTKAHMDDLIAQATATHEAAVASGQGADEAAQVRDTLVEVMGAIGL